MAPGSPAAGANGPTARSRESMASYLVQPINTTRSGSPDHTGAATTINTQAPGVTIPDPGVVPQLADTDAPVCCVYYSTTQSALVFKTPAGVVNLITTSLPS